MEFDLSFLAPEIRAPLHNAIDAISIAGAWDYVKAGKLIQAQKMRGLEPLDNIATMIFDAMSSTEPWIILEVTEIAKNFETWRDQCLVASLMRTKNELNYFLDHEYTEKFASNDRFDEGRKKVLNSIDRCYLASDVMSEDNRYALQYILKMDNISYLENEVLLNMIDEHIRRL
jgi:hypothetical protein